MPTSTNMPSTSKANIHLLYVNSIKTHRHWLCALSRTPVSPVLVLKTWQLKLISSCHSVTSFEQSQGNHWQVATQDQGFQVVNRSTTMS